MKTKLFGHLISIITCIHSSLVSRQAKGGFAITWGVEKNHDSLISQKSNLILQCCYWQLPLLPQPNPKLVSTDQVQKWRLPKMDYFFSRCTVALISVPVIILSFFRFVFLRLNKAKNSSIKYWCHNIRARTYVKKIRLREPKFLWKYTGLVSSSRIFSDKTILVWCKIWR